MQLKLRPLGRSVVFLLVLVLIATVFAAERPRLRVDDYVINAAVTPRSHHLHATAQVKFTALDDINSAVFELHNALRVNHVTGASGEKIQFERISQDNSVRLTLPKTLAKDDSTTLTFDYDGALGSADDSPVEGLKLAYIGEDTSYLLYAGRWFPVNGYGINRFTAKINVAVPAGYTIVGSGRTTPSTPITMTIEQPAAAPENTANDSSNEGTAPILRRRAAETPATPNVATTRRSTTRTRRTTSTAAKTAPPVTTHSVAPTGSTTFSFAWQKPSFPGTLIIGKFQETASQLNGANIHVFFPTNHAGFATSYAETAGKEFSYFSSMYGPAPSSTLNIVELPDDTVPYAWAPEVAAIASRAVNAKVDYRLLANTIAHQWWGASVSPSSTEDGWLRDGAARYAEARYIESAAGEAGYEEAVKDMEVGALAYDNIPLASVGKLPPFSPEAQSLSSDKGAMMFEMLRWVMGDEPFDNTMRQFAMQFAGKAANSNDFRQIAEQHFGDRLEWFFAEWLDSTGAPEFKNKYTVYRIPKGFRVSGQISQDLDLFRMPVKLKIDTDGKPEDKRIEVVGTESPYTIETFGMPRKITIDPDNRVLKSSGDLKLRVAIMKGEQLVQQGDLAQALTELQRALEINKNSSLAHYRIAEVFFQQRNYQAAANEYRAAREGDGEPRWTEVWSSIQLGKIFDTTGQRNRAVNEYRRALETNDNFQGALDEARKYLAAPYQRDSKGSSGQ
ncbi:MAG TPA: M1 family aminopeptidase [Terriglobales bacterium]|nr:M1 family aminopeptidase [Terriglobales bacterium]